MGLKRVKVCEYLNNYIIDIKVNRFITEKELDILFKEFIENYSGILDTYDLEGNYNILVIDNTLKIKLEIDLDSNCNQKDTIVNIKKHINNFKYDLEHFLIPGYAKETYNRILSNIYKDICNKHPKAIIDYLYFDSPIKDLNYIKVRDCEKEQILTQEYPLKYMGCDSVGGIYMLDEYNKEVEKWNNL